MNVSHLLPRYLVSLAWMLLATVGQVQSATPGALTTPGEKLTSEQAVALFKTLPAPTMEAMNGEFSGEMLSFPTLYTRLFWAIARNRLPAH